MDVPTLPRSWWEKHPEVAEFVRGLFGKMRIVDMPGAVAAQFGPGMKPSKSAIARYMARLRGGPGLGLKPSRSRPKSRSRPQIRARRQEVPRDAAKGREAAKNPD